MNPNGADKQNPNYITDPRIVWVARALMGSIDLDPASSAYANTHIKAGTFYDSEGLTRPWFGNVFCNPPGGQKNDAVAWWERLLTQPIQVGFYVSFSLDRLQTSQRGCPLTAYPTFIPAKRMAYLNHDTWTDKHGNTRVQGLVDPQPPKPSCFTLVKRGWTWEDVKSMKDLFNMVNIPGYVVGNL